VQRPRRAWRKVPADDGDQAAEDGGERGGGAGAVEYVAAALHREIVAGGDDAWSGIDRAEQLAATSA
jgi:hypothetical protein